LNEKQPGEMTRTEAAAFFGVGVDTLGKYVKAHNIPYRRFGQRIFFKKVDLERVKQIYRQEGGENKEPT